MFLYEKIDVILQELKNCISNKEFSIDNFKYAELEGGQILEMDYKEGKYCMDILLPSKEHSLDKMIAPHAQVRNQSFRSPPYVVHYTLRRGV